MSENPALLIPVILVAFVIGFGCLWLFISFLSSRLWGWHAMAQHYQGEIAESAVNERFSWRSGRFGWGGYSGVLTFTVGEHDLGISVLFLYRAGHPPLKIPYNEITAEEKTVILPEVHLSFERVPNRSLKISRSLANQIDEASNGKLGLKSAD